MKFKTQQLFCLILIISQLLVNVSSFYLPGVSPKEYVEGEIVPLKVNKMVSAKTQVPYPYYSLKFCTPPEGIQETAENLGEILLGDRIENSPYIVSFTFFSKQSFSLKTISIIFTKIKFKVGIWNSCTM
jgi:transmembrane 9 superfamily member 2/4